MNLFHNNYNRMSWLARQFKKENIEEYLVMALEAFKSNDPYFKLGIYNDRDFLR
jgi:hypothetical protein